MLRVSAARAAAAPAPPRTQAEAGRRPPARGAGRAAPAVPSPYRQADPPFLDATLRAAHRDDGRAAALASLSKSFADRDRRPAAHGGSAFSSATSTYSSIRGQVSAARISEGRLGLAAGPRSGVRRGLHPGLELIAPAALRAGRPGSAIFRSTSPANSVARTSRRPPPGWC